MKSAQSCLTFCNPMDCIVHGILQASILEWVAFPFSRGSSQPRDQTQVSLIAGRFFTSWATREAQEYWSGYLIPSPVYFPDPGIKPGSPALQADSLPSELWGKPYGPLKLFAFHGGKEPFLHLWFEKLLVWTHIGPVWVKCTFFKWLRVIELERGPYSEWLYID